MRLKTLTAATLAAAAAGAVTAHATIPDAGGTINGCYAPSSATPHALAVVDDPSECPTSKGSVLLPFNQRVPAGAPGARGPDGSVRVPHQVTADLVGTDGVDAGGRFGRFTGTATCPAGEFAVSGGYDLRDEHGNYDIVASHAVVEDGVPRGWTATAELRVQPFAGLDPAAILAAVQAEFGEIAAGLQQQADVFGALAAGLGSHGPGGKSLSGGEARRIRIAARGVPSSLKSVRAGAQHVALTTTQHVPVVPGTGSSGPLAPQVSVLCTGA